MSVTAPGAGFGLAALTAWARASVTAALDPGRVADVGAASQARKAADAGGRGAMIGLPVADAVMIRMPAGAMFREMATAGLRQLGALLPAIQRQLASSAEPLPAALGHLARAVGDAAYQVATGFSGDEAAAAGTAVEGTMVAGDGLESRAAGSLANAASDGAAHGVATAPREAAAKRDGPAASADRETGSGGPGGRGAPERIGSLPSSSGCAGQAAVARVAGFRLAGSPQAPSKAVADGLDGLAARDGEASNRTSLARPSLGHPGWGRPSSSQDMDARGMVGNGVGSLADAAVPLPEVMSRWRVLAQDTLQRASTILEQVSERLQPAPSHPHPAPGDMTATPGSDLSWAVLQVAGAQRQVALSMTILTGAACERAATPRRGMAGQTGREAASWRRVNGFDRMISAVALAGTMLLVGLLGATFGLWVIGISILAVALTVGAAGLWGWRVVVGAKGLRIMVRRPD